MTSTDPVPWWLWPNLLAIDAPAVAVVWQRFLGDRLGIPVPPVTSAVLALAVWGVYLADRWLDARRGPQPDLADRHRFAGRHPRLFVALALVSLLTAAGLAVVALPPELLAAGAAVGLVTAGYFALVHRFAGPDRIGAKEFVVGVVFAVGVGLPVAVARPGAWAEWGPPLLALAGLGGMNCALITVWETDPARVPPVGCLQNASTAGALLFAWFSEPAVAAAVAAAWASLAATHFAVAALYPAPGAIGVRAARVLADVALLTPLLAGLLP